MQPTPTRPPSFFIVGTLFIYRNLNIMYKGKKKHLRKCPLTFVRLATVYFTLILVLFVKNKRSYNWALRNTRYNDIYFSISKTRSRSRLRLQVNDASGAEIKIGACLSYTRFGVHLSAFFLWCIILNEERY